MVTSALIAMDHGTRVATDKTVDVNWQRQEV